MGLGTGVFLIVLGLILLTGVIRIDVGLAEGTTLGSIVLGAGILLMALALAMNHQRSRTAHGEEHGVDRNRT